MIRNKMTSKKFLPLRLCYFSFRERVRREISDEEVETRLLVGGNAEFSNTALDVFLLEEITWRV